MAGAGCNARVDYYFALAEAVTYLMKMTIRFGAPAIKLGLAIALMAQVQTDVPPVVPGAKPVAVEHIKIHGKALEGNLEGDAVDRDAFVFLPPSYATDKNRRYPVVYAL